MELTAAQLPLVIISKEEYDRLLEIKRAFDEKKVFLQHDAEWHHYGPGSGVKEHWYQILDSPDELFKSVIAEKDLQIKQLIEFRNELQDKNKILVNTVASLDKKKKRYPWNS